MASKSKEKWTPEQYVQYILSGGTVGAMSGVTQGRVTQMLMADPRLASQVARLLAQRYSSTSGAPFDPNKQYATGPASFEAQYNPVREKYMARDEASRKVAEAAFALIDSGKSPAEVTGILTDPETYKTLGVDSNNAGVVNLVAELNSGGLEDYSKAETERSGAASKQQYQAYLEQTKKAGSTPQEYIAKTLGIPSIAGLEDPSKRYQFTMGNIGDVPQMQELLARYQPTVPSLSPQRQLEMLQKAYVDAERKKREGYQWGTSKPPKRNWYDIRMSTDVVTAPASRLIEDIVRINRPEIKAPTTLEDALSKVAGSEEATAAYRAALRNAPETIQTETEAMRARRVQKRVLEKLNAAGIKLEAEGYTPFTTGLAGLSGFLGAVNPKTK